MVNIGVVGLGFMGRIHYLAARNVSGGRVAAVCSREARKLAGDWRGARGNFGPPGEQMDLGDIGRYGTLDELLADPAIDLIDICNPTHLHPDTAIAALRAGKHVLVEKPIALTPADADRMLAAAAASGRMLMVAHVLPFVPEFAFVADAVRSGRYGKLVAAHFLRVISRPDWSADMADASKTGGPAIDLHVHDTHFIGLLAGVPRAVSGVGRVDGDEVSYLSTNYHYGPGGPAVSCSSGAVAASGRPFAHAFEVYLERATLSFHSAGLPLTLATADGQSSRPDLAGGDDPVNAFTAELQAAVDGVRTGRVPDHLSGQLARDALVLCHKECEAVRTGREVTIS